MKISRIVGVAVVMLLASLGGFLLGGTWGKLTIAPGSGLAGAGEGAIYALAGALGGCLAGAGLVGRVGKGHLPPLLLGSATFCGAAWLALTMTPRRTLDLEPHVPPPDYEPAYLFHLSVGPDDALDEDSVASAAGLPFRRLHLSTASRTLRISPVDSTVACNAELPAVAVLDELRVAARAVEERCTSEGCADPACPECALWSMDVAVDGEEREHHPMTGEYLTDSAEGRALTDVLRRVDEAARPWKYCGS